VEVTQEIEEEVVVEEEEDLSTTDSREFFC
jgi:hypothetical protein